MSRIGKMPITIPEKVKVLVDDNNNVTVTGPLGTLNRTIDKDFKINIENNVLTVERFSEDKNIKAKHGLYRSLINNMVEGVNVGYKKTLIVAGVGYRLSKQGNKVVMNIGFSKPKTVTEVDGITLTPEGNDKIVVSGIDKELVGQMASKIRDIKPVEPYHLYGIRYDYEVVSKKEVKKVGKK